MLEKLKNLKMPATSEGIIYFLNILRQYDNISIDDLKILCNHSPNGLLISFEEIIKYCEALRFIYIDSGVHLNPDMVSIINPLLIEETTYRIVAHELSMFFSCEIFKPDMFAFDVNAGLYRFKNEKLPLSYTSVRNILVSQGFFYVKRQTYRSDFYVRSEYEKDVRIFCSEQKKKMSLRQLQIELEKNAQAGDLAEKYVLEFEKNDWVILRLQK